MRSKPVWDQIKKTAIAKGIELSIESIRIMAKTAIAFIASQ
jgi:hypothetical protein